MYNQSLFFQIVSSNIPVAAALINGNSAHEHLTGVVQFYYVPFGGMIIATELAGLPAGMVNGPEFLGFHIHETGDCSDDFNHTGNHYNPDNLPHPHHLGDLPPILNNNGYAYSVVYNSYLKTSDVLGKSVIIHSQRDDFTTQPSGDSGTKIGCGLITAVRCADYRNEFPNTI